MKKIVFLLLVFASLATFTSCKKCVTCVYQYNGPLLSYTYTYPEKCGKRKEINDYIKACKDRADSVNGATCTCTNK
jgi:hypothetical protein